MEAINRFSRQGPGGTFELTGFSSLKYCLLCGKNCTCMSSCMGPPPRRKPSVVQLGRMIVPPSVIPGLADASSLPSITLTSVTKTVSNKNPDSGDKFGNLFGWPLQQQEF